MSELNSTQTRKAREICRERDGDRCTYPGCNKSGEEYRKEKGRDLDLHHRDRNRENNPWDGSNWSLMCHSCNCLNDPRGKSKGLPKFNKFRMLKNRDKERVNVNERIWNGDDEWKWNQSNIMPAIMKKSLEAKPVFREAVEIMVRTLHVVRRKDLIDGCSEKANCSQAAGARYLDSLCSFFGRYEYIGRNEHNQVVPINEIKNYQGEIFVREKLAKDEKKEEPKVNVDVPAVHINGNGVHNK